MLVLGLTGSIAMGKTTAARMFRQQGTPVYDSDATVHDFYRYDAAQFLRPHFPDAVISGAVDRKKLSDYVLENPNNMTILESIVHPYVERKRNEFIRKNKLHGTGIIVLDIPLLFEIGGDRSVDMILVVSASEEIQHTRALARPNMTHEKFISIKSKQIPDAQKRRRAHYVISSEHGYEHMESQIKSVLRTVR